MGGKADCSDSMGRQAKHRDVVASFTFKMKQIRSPYLHMLIPIENLLTTGRDKIQNSAGFENKNK